MVPALVREANGRLRRLGEEIEAMEVAMSMEDTTSRLAAQMFRVLVIKTGSTIPYTSIFFQLDRAYWKDEMRNESFG